MTITILVTNLCWTVNLDKEILFYKIESMVSSNQSGWHHFDSMLKVHYIEKIERDRSLRAQDVEIETREKV